MLFSIKQYFFKIITLFFKLNLIYSTKYKNTHIYSAYPLIGFSVLNLPSTEEISSFLTSPTVITGLTLTTAVLMGYGTYSYIYRELPSDNTLLLNNLKDVNINYKLYFDGVFVKLERLLYLLDCDTCKFFDIPSMTSMYTRRIMDPDDKIIREGYTLLENDVLDILELLKLDCLGDTKREALLDEISPNFLIASNILYKHIAIYLMDLTTLSFRVKQVLRNWPNWSNADFEEHQLLFQNVGKYYGKLHGEPLSTLDFKAHVRRILVMNRDKNAEDTFSDINYVMFYVTDTTLLFIDEVANLTELCLNLDELIKLI